MSGRLVRRVDERCAVIGTYHVASERVLPCIGAAALRVLKTRSAPRFDEVISVSRTAADFAARWSRIDAARVIPNMLDAAAARAQAQTTGVVAADIVFVGRLVPRKGAAELLEAVGRLCELPGHAGATVAIIGDGPLRRSLERRSRRLGVDGQVTFYGALDDTQKLAALRQARIACFPSLFGESFGVVILEALAAGAEAVLAGRNPGYAELLGDPESLIDPRDPVTFAARLAVLLEDGAKRHELGRRQRKLLARCDTDSVVDSVIEVYEQAMHARRGGARRPNEHALERIAA
jgi:phosphatidylinositol alpha-mannosyltransferase